jgi:cellulose synthase/poly-beta-1,6-N-acetylglucosamine synthase-like glycosyltransferase
MHIAELSLTDQRVWIAIVAVMWALAMIQAVRSFVEGLRFARYMRIASERPAARGFTPPATVFLPCCGVDDELAQTIAALGAQDYPNYEVVFTFESTDDPAYDAVGRWAESWRGVPWKRVVAGIADSRSQKVHNLLAAVNEARGASAVFAFLDSDAIPHADWLARLVAPLADPRVGAATGFRWYTANGGLTTGLRSAWNAATISFLHDPRFAFCWGGSSAITTQNFARFRIAQRWAGALSDDFQLTRGVHEAGLTIRFVPQCLICCDEATTFGQFWRFARRQLMITRLCAPTLFWAGLTLAVHFVIGTSAVFVLLVYLLATAQWTLALITGVAWMTLIQLAKGKAALRQKGVSRFLGPPQWTRRDWAYDVFGSEAVGVLHMCLMLSAAVGRRIQWRHTLYEMVSPDETRIISRSAGV